TGQSLRSSPVTCFSWSNSFTFFGALVCAGQKRSPGRQFRTVNSPAAAPESSKFSALHAARFSAVISIASNNVPVYGTGNLPGATPNTMYLRPPHVIIRPQLGQSPLTQPRARGPKDTNTDPTGTKYRAALDCAHAADLDY